MLGGHFIRYSDSFTPHRLRTIFKLSGSVSDLPTVRWGNISEGSKCDVRTARVITGLGSFAAGCALELMTTASGYPWIAGIFGAGIGLVISSPYDRIPETKIVKVVTQQMRLRQQYLTLTRDPLFRISQEEKIETDQIERINYNQHNPLVYTFNQWDTSASRLISMETVAQTLFDEQQSLISKVRSIIPASRIHPIF